MKDKDRIPRIIEKLKDKWQEYPDWRLGQLIANISQVLRNDPEPFYLSDNDLEDFLDKDDTDYWQIKEDGE